MNKKTLSTIIETKAQNKLRELLKLEKSKPVSENVGNWDSCIVWRLSDGTKHRDFGPAIVFITGKKLWYQNGRLHREGGPAIESPCGMNLYYLNGVPTSKKKAVKILKKMKSA